MIKAIVRKLYMTIYKKELIQVRAYVYSQRNIYNNDKDTSLSETGKRLTAIGKTKGALDTLEILNLFIKE